MELLARRPRGWILLAWWILVACLGGGEAAGDEKATTTGALLAEYIASGIGITSDHKTSSLPTSPRLNSSHNTTSSADESLATGSSNDTCWAQWEDYWSSKAPYSTPATTSWVIATDLWAYVPYLTTTKWISENSWTLTSLSTDYSDDYPISVHTSLTTSTGGGDWMTVTENSAISTMSLRSYLATDWETTTRSGVTTPPCHLPSLVPQCESQWSSYMAQQDTITDERTPKPPCTQASVKSSDCETLVSQYLFQWTWNGETEGVGYQTKMNSTYWPTSKSFAPGCSLGCRKCSVTGQSVQLYWWPPATKALVENGTATATLTSSPNNISLPVSALVDGTYLTSPTVYISYDTLYASDSCSGVGASYTNTIIPLSNSDHLFSMETRWDPRISVHGFKTVPFNYTDLMEPIPDSIYNKQARCQKSYTGFIIAGGLKSNATFSCARTGPYAPIIAVPPEVQSLDPLWEECEAWYGGLYDPPLALQPASAEASPTLPFPIGPTTTQASPSQSVDPSSPKVTALPITQAEDPRPKQTSPNGAEVIAGIFIPSSGLLTESTPGPTFPEEFQTTMTLDGQAYSISRKGQSIYVNGMQADPDHVVTVSGHAFSFGSSAMAIDDETITYAAAVSAATTMGAHQTALTLDGQVYTVEEKSGSLFINGMQAETEHPVIVSGHVFSAGSSALEVDGSTAWMYASPTGGASTEDTTEYQDVDGSSTTPRTAGSSAGPTAASQSTITPETSPADQPSLPVTSSSGSFTTTAGFMTIAILLLFSIIFSLR